MVLFFAFNLAHAYRASIHNIPEKIKIVMPGKSLKNYYNLIEEAYYSSPSNITENFKDKKFKIQGSYLNLDNKKVFFDGKARITGDYKDHIDIKNKISSISINLKNTSIGGVTNFRLLLPKTKKDFNEIFWSSLMEVIGYPTPLRKYIKAEVNGIENIYIFEEKTEKEFLESIAYRESPILETDERQFWENISHEHTENKISRKYTHQLKLKNSDFIKNPISEEIAYRSLSPKKKSLSKDRYFATKNSQLPNNPIIETYDLINKSYAYHGLSANNRKYIYDPLYNDYVPIYFDGMPKNLGEKHDCEKFNINDYDNQVKASVNLLEAKFLNRTLRLKDKLGHLYSCIAANYLVFVKNKQIKLKSIRPLSISKTDMKNNSTNILKKLNDPTKFAYPDVIDIDIQKKIIQRFSFDDRNKSWEKSEDISFSKFKKFITGGDKPKKIYEYNIYNLIEINSIPIREEEFANLKIHNKSIDIFVPKNQSKYIKLDANNANINIKLEGSDSKIIFYQSEIIDSNIRSQVVNPKEENLLARYDLRLITGCNTFIDSKIINSTLVSDNCSLEDGINLVRVEGNKLNLLINNAKYDGLDADYSRINFNTIRITNSGNDCVDVSSGVYNFDINFLKNCGDKGVSIGEKSITSFLDLNIENAHLGLAVKDLSIASIVNFSGKNLNECMNAYRKKQEFDYGTIYYNNTLGNCNISLKDNSKHFSDNICHKVDSNEYYNTCFTDKDILIDVRNSLPKETEFFLKKINNDKFILKLNSKDCERMKKCRIKLPADSKKIKFGLQDHNTGYIYFSFNNLI